MLSDPWGNNYFPLKKVKPDNKFESSLPQLAGLARKIYLDTGCDAKNNADLITKNKKKTLKENLALFFSPPTRCTNDILLC